MSVREIAKKFSDLFEVELEFVGKEAKTALLSNSQIAYNLYGLPKVPIENIIEWIAEWLRKDKKILGKPTHYEVRDGKY